MTFVLLYIIIILYFNYNFHNNNAKKYKESANKMNNLITNIISYLKYLNKDCGLNVSLHFDHGILNRIPKNILLQLSPFNCHTNAYCVMAKNIDLYKCLLNQKNLLNKCQNGEAFCHSCYAEVYEYIYPICIDSVAIGFIAVSGYKPFSPNKCNILNRDLWETLQDAEIPVNLYNSVIPPLCIMLEHLLQSNLKENGDEYNLILQFLNEYHTNITLSDLAKHFNRSKSHISHLFKKTNGETIRSYCNILKLEDAKKLLLNTNMPITDIAYNVGFNDTSYFISLFKSTFGITPLHYRRINK